MTTSPPGLTRTRRRAEQTHWTQRTSQPTDSDNLCDDAQDDDNDGDGFSNADETTNCFDSTTSTGKTRRQHGRPTDTDDDECDLSTRTTTMTASQTRMTPST